MAYWPRLKFSSCLPKMVFVCTRATAMVLGFACTNYSGLARCYGFTAVCVAAVAARQHQAKHLCRPYWRSWLPGKELLLAVFYCTQFIVNDVSCPPEEIIKELLGL